MADVEIQPKISTLAQLRDDLSFTQDFAFFQTGSEGPAPDSTQRAIWATLKQANGPALGGLKRYLALAQRAEKARESLATLLNVSAGELTWTTNTTSAIRLAVHSLPWQPGEKVAISGTEHTSTRTLIKGLEDNLGCETTVIPVGDGPTYSPSAFLNELECLLSPDHRLLILSHVSCIDGRRLPVADATLIAHQRGVKVLVDGAQAVGQFSVDVGEIDPEFYAGSIHKWLLGPAGIGYLMVAKRQLPEFNPGLRPAPDTKHLQGNEHSLTASGQTEIGTQSMSLRMGTRHSIEMIQRIGLDEIEAHSRDLTAQLRDGLRRIGGLTVISPHPWTLSSGITSIKLHGYTPERVHNLIDRIWEDYRAVVKFQVDFAGIRISVAGFNSHEEVRRLLKALEALVPRM